MTLSSFDDGDSDEARQALLDRRCERSHPKRHRTQKRAKALASGPRLRGGARSRRRAAADGVRRGCDGEGVMASSRAIYCANCGCEVQARLTSGAEVYPHRRDLANLPFWRCDACRGHVGCHHKTDDPTRPLGVIPSPALANARQELHKLIDPIWKSGKCSRSKVYREIAARLGIAEFHTAELRTIEDARSAYVAARAFRDGL